VVPGVFLVSRWRDQNNCESFFFSKRRKEHEHIKTVFALTINSIMSCMRNIQFVLQNRRYFAMLMLQFSY
jgi:hypothetical protein